MTGGDSHYDELGNERQFNDALNTLLRVADENDIDIEGSWDCRNSACYADWDVTISTVKKPPAPNADE